MRPLARPLAFLVLLCGAAAGGVGSAQAGCTLGDLSAALAGTATGGADFAVNHPACSAKLADPDFDSVAAAVTGAMAAKPSLVTPACDSVFNLQNEIASGQKSLSSLNTSDLASQFPDDVKAALDQLVGNLGNLSAAVDYVACACHLAEDSGIAQLADTAGSCITDALCDLAGLFGVSCDCQPAPPILVDCADPIRDHDSHFVVGNMLPDPGADDYCQDNFCYYGAQPYYGCDQPYFCYCPPPMHPQTDHPYDDSLNDSGYRFLTCDCPDGTHAAGSGPVLSRICLCPDGQPVRSDGQCPAPKPPTPACNIACKNNLVPTVQDESSCAFTCGCPSGQAQMGDHCVTPCASAGDILLADGSCCPPSQATSCGVCCPQGQRPDEKSGSCVSATGPPPLPTPFVPKRPTGL